MRFFTLQLCLNRSDQVHSEDRAGLQSSSETYAPYGWVERKSGAVFPSGGRKKKTCMYLYSIYTHTHIIYGTKKKNTAT